MRAQAEQELSDARQEARGILVDAGAARDRLLEQARAEAKQEALRLSTMLARSSRKSGGPWSLSCGGSSPKRLSRLPSLSCEKHWMSRGTGS